MKLGGRIGPEIRKSVNIGAISGVGRTKPVNCLSPFLATTTLTGLHALLTDLTRTFSFDVFAKYE